MRSTGPMELPSRLYVIFQIFIFFASFPLFSLAFFAAKFKKWGAESSSSAMTVGVDYRDIASIDSIPIVAIDKRS